PCPRRPWLYPNHPNQNPATNLPLQLRLQCARMKKLGIDFTGAIIGGRAIWFSGGVRDGVGWPITSCERAADHWGSRLEPCLAQLVEAINREGSAAIGFDFPFGLPSQVITETSWKEFVDRFSQRYPDAETFRRECSIKAGGRELRRLTD